MKFGRIPPAATIASIYLLFGTAWILGTDYLLALYAHNNEQLMVNLGKAKGGFFIATSALLLFGIIHWFCKQHQDAVTKANALAERYKALYHSISEGVFEYDCTTGEAEINDHLRNKLGYDSCRIAHFFQKNMKQIHPEDKERVRRVMEKFSQDTHGTWQMEFRYLCPDQTYHDIIGRGYKIFNKESGKVERCVGTLHDISELKNIKAQVLSKELQYRQKANIGVIKAQEEERNRLAMELHDNIGQLLSVARLYTEHLSGQYNDPLLPKVKGILVDAANEIRHLSFSMKPPEFKNSSLAEAIDSLVDRMTKAQPFQIIVDYAGISEEHMNEEHRLMAYRIIQEQLTNIVKHAQARQVHIRLNNDKREAHVEVTDDGIGFNSKGPATGIGLRNIRSRLELFNGDLEIISNSGSGCTMLAHFSLG